MPRSSTDKAEKSQGEKRWGESYLAGENSAGVLLTCIYHIVEAIRGHDRNKVDFSYDIEPKAQREVHYKIKGRV
jgi:hypothetical protein